MKSQFCVYLHRIKRFLRKMKFRYQRLAKGYSDEDLMYMNEWFTDTMYRMISELRENIDHIPQNKNIHEDMLEMENCLCLMSIEGAVAEVGEKAYSYEVVQKVMNENKDKFFKLFSDNFWDLWQ